MISEKDKYSEIWSNRNYRSGKSQPFAKIVEGHCSGKVLDLGCGNCETATYLSCRSKYYGLDITTKQITLDVPFFEYAAWDVDKVPLDFDWTISNDFLEHLPPERVEEVVEKMLKKSLKGSIHAISTRTAQKYDGHEVHLTVKPLSWWQEIFDKYKGNKKVVLIDADKL